MKSKTQSFFPLLFPFKIFSLLILTIFIPKEVLKAQAPDTDIYLFSIKGNRVFGKPQKLTFHIGYDNQPSFMPGGNQLLYTSIDESGQADIWMYDMLEAENTQITNTPNTSEFSPTYVPSLKCLSVIRVEEDNETQRIWKLDQNNGDLNLLYPHSKNIGYHSWVDSTNLIVFRVGEPNTLEWLNLEDSITWLITGQVGRCINSIPNENALSFVHQISESNWLIKRIDYESRDITSLIPTLPGVADYAWSPEGKLWAGKDGQLFIANLEEGRWDLVKDFNAFGLNYFDRIAISNDGSKIAIVVYR